MLLTGIDEAGYGPVLGPLVVASVTFEIADRNQGRCLWSLLERAVTKRARPARSDPRLPVCDSKKLHAGPQKLARLERTAAAFLPLAGHALTDFASLIAAIADHPPGQVEAPPWFAEDDLSLPVKACPTEIRTQRAAVSSGMRAAGIRLAAVRAVVLSAADYNRMVTATQNKAAVLFWATMRLAVRALAENSSAHTLLIDRQGGRRSYARVLLKSLDLDTLHVAAENDRASRYTLTHLGHLCDLGFYKRGEEQHFAIALAGIMAKYLRELSMQLFNRYWCRRIPGLSATAGYYTDGLRFFREIESQLGRLGIAPASVLRVR